MKRIILASILLISGSYTQAQSTLESMKEVVSYLASDELQGRETGTAAEKEAADYIKSKFESLGLEPRGEVGFFQDFTYTPKANPHQAPSEQNKDYKPVTGRNVIGYVNNGAEYTIIIGAHYDHLGMGGEGSRYKGEPAIHNGADDNASGVAVLLELAKRLRNSEQRHNYLIMAFSGEEKGLWGSNHYMKHPTIDTSKVSYMMNFDMVGRLSDSQKLAIYGTGTSPSFDSVLNAANEPTKFHMVKKESGVGPSDHTSFYLKGYPVLHFFTGQHEDYHKPTDDEEFINYEGMEMIVDFTFDVISELDLTPKLLYKRTKDEESHKALKYSVTLGVVPDYLFEGEGMRIDGTSEGKPAQKAGIIAGDVVIKMGDIDVPDMMGYMKALGKFKKGDKAVVVVLRKGKKVKVNVTF
jgi:hypothetical protein